jgi:hypothetical protein
VGNFQLNTFAMPPTITDVMHMAPWKWMIPSDCLHVPRAQVLRHSRCEYLITSTQIDSAVIASASVHRDDALGMR